MNGYIPYAAELEKTYHLHVVMSVIGAFLTTKSGSDCHFGAADKGLVRAAAGLADSFKGEVLNCELYTLINL